jgi:hypothetical protein
VRAVIPRRQGFRLGRSLAGSGAAPLLLLFTRNGRASFSIEQDGDARYSERDMPFTWMEFAALLEAKIDASSIPPAEKSIIKKTIEGMSEAALKTATTDLVRIGLHNKRNAFERC